MDYRLLFYRSRFGKKDILTSSETYIRIVFCRKRCFPSFYCVKTRALSYERCRGKSSPRSQVLAALLAACRCGLVCSPFVIILSLYLKFTVSKFLPTLLILNSRSPTYRNKTIIYKGKPNITPISPVSYSIFCWHCNILTKYFFYIVYRHII